MDDVDRKLLNIIQTDFPVVSRPYEVLAESLGITEEEALKRVRRLVESGVIRRIGPSFDTRRLGHVSVLVAAQIPSERLEEVAKVVSSYPHVTHNYGREHRYNLWFTLVCRDEGEVRRILDEIERRTGIGDMRVLPAERMFKIRVSFEL